MASEHVHTLLAEGLSTGAFPGAALQAGIGSSPLLTVRTGDAAVHPQRMPVMDETRYDMASLSKWMSTAMITLRLLAAGKLTLEDTLGDWFDAPSATSAITIRQLLTHTSGLPPHLPLWERLQAHGTPVDVRMADGVTARTAILADRSAASRLLLETMPLTPPGSSVAYSCMGYILLGFLLEKAGGAPLDVLARRWVFDPLGMRHTGYRPLAGPKTPEARALDGSLSDGGSGEETLLQPDIPCASTEHDGAADVWWNGVVHDENARFLGGLSGNAGIFSTLSDCARFAAMMAGHGTLEGKGFLPSALFDVAIKNHTPGLEESRGLGASLYDGRLLSCGDLFPIGTFGHTGFTGTSMWVNPENGLYVVLLTNAVHFGRNRTAFFRLRRRIHNAISGSLSL